ncbi:SDR family NAD(P)-dependent oxidoreductase [Oceanobacillus polygoni]|uniref:3alpha(Or 20beta)-hydroxysteroid dehydrogenase n=1 Tax=Oceanobacillus polygoni TaxID=1235259 RepID=A0A9X0YRV7_9BACI|nr:SDR family oxidoreductase [Oceanobacillus polygoni]MBP2076094.1 3alpha(or 20beta)-hydroxysteroid dehydrogenase [Oceanobacillus polygoni]
MAGKLKGKVALITGASSGLGLADTIEFVKEEADTVIMVSNNSNKLNNAAEVVKRYGNSTILTYQLDVASESEWKRFNQQIIKKIDRLDVLVNNAGVNKRDTFQQCTLEDWNRIIAVNQTGVFLGMKYCLELLKKSDSPSIINLSSITGLTGYFAVAYTAAKWAVRGMTKSAAAEFGKWGIRVNSVHPGFINTPLNESIQNLIKVSNEMNPLERAGESFEIAKVVTFLASNESSYMTGSEVVIDGGLTSGGQFKPIAHQFNIY